MRLLKGFLFTLTGLLFVITLFSLLMPSRVMTSRSVTINVKDPAVVMRQLNDLNNWKNWHPVFNQPGITIRPGNGDYASWEHSSKINSLQIVEVSGNTIRFFLKRSGETDQENKISLLKANESNAVHVEWAALTRLRWYPWEKFSGLFIEKITGEGYQQALDSLKNYLEQ